MRVGDTPTLFRAAVLKPYSNPAPFGVTIRQPLGRDVVHFGGDADAKEAEAPPKRMNPLKSLLRRYRERRGMRNFSIRPSRRTNDNLPVKKQENQTRLSDVKGHDEALVEIHEVVQYIRAANRRKALEKYEASLQAKEKPEVPVEKPAPDPELDELIESIDNLKGQIPRGIILWGPPGTGKTMIARAIASEIDAQFFEASGSEFVNKYVGVGAATVRKLFAAAKRAERAIVFIDEIDAVGGKRTESTNSEIAQTLNQLLVEMDGFKENDNVTVIFATNRIDMLDDALLRPGRVDIQIQIGKPDKRGRQDILDLYADKRPLAQGVTMSDIATMTRGFSGADLKNLVERASKLAIRGRQHELTRENFSSAFEEVLLGLPRPNLLIKHATRQKVAAHEVMGHGLAAIACKVPLFVVSMVPRDKSLGHVIKDPEHRDEFMVSRQDLLEDILIAAAGRAAERFFYGRHQISTGASGDYQQIQAMFRQLRTNGLLDDGIVVDYRDPHRKLSPHDEKLLSDIINHAEKTAMALIELVPEEVRNQLIDESLTAGSMIQDAANKFYMDRLLDYDWEAAYMLVEDFIEDPSGEADRAEADEDELLE